MRFWVDVCVLFCGLGRDVERLLCFLLLIYFLKGVGTRGSINRIGKFCIYSGARSCGGFVISSCQFCSGDVCRGASSDVQDLFIRCE